MKKKSCNIILSSAYLGPIQYFSRFISEEDILIEQYDHYLKQTYRNRCVILSANGPLPLIIPVVKEHGKKMLMKDVQIDYATNWQRLHLNGIISAYRSSAFFEFYFDGFEPFYRKKTTFLIDLNTEMTKIILDYLGIDREIRLTKEFLKPEGLSNDYRATIHPKVSLASDQEYHPVPYMQTFSDRHDFIPNMSIIDLLFNAGPEARLILDAGIENNK